MARIDKYEPHIGGTRARLAAAWLLANVGKIVAVGLDANGRAVVGAGASGIIGVCVLQATHPAGHQIDILQRADIVEVATSDITGVVAGKKVYMNAAGVMAVTAITTAIGVAGTNGYYVGHTVEADRLVLRFQEVQA